MKGISVAITLALELLKAGLKISTLVGTAVREGRDLDMHELKAVREFDDEARAALVAAINGPVG